MILLCSIGLIIVGFFLLVPSMINQTNLPSSESLDPYEMYLGGMIMLGMIGTLCSIRMYEWTKDKTSCQCSCSEPKVEPPTEKEEIWPVNAPLPVKAILLQWFKEFIDEDLEALNDKIKSKLASCEEAELKFVSEQYHLLKNYRESCKTVFDCSAAMYNNFDIRHTNCQPFELYNQS